MPLTDPFTIISLTLCSFFLIAVALVNRFSRYKIVGLNDANIGFVYLRLGIDFITILFCVCLVGSSFLPGIIAFFWGNENGKTLYQFVTNAIERNPTMMFGIGLNMSISLGMQILRSFKRKTGNKTAQFPYKS